MEFQLGIVEEIKHSELFSTPSFSKSSIVTAPSKNLQKISIVEKDLNSSFTPSMNSQEMTGLSSAMQRTTECEKQKRFLQNSKIWNEIIEVDVEKYVNLDEIQQELLGNSNELERNSYHDAPMNPDLPPKTISFQNLLNENAELIIKLHKLQESRLNIGKITPTAEEVEIAKIIEGNLVGLVGKCKPKDLIDNERLEKVMKGLPIHEEGWIGTQPPISN